MILNTGQYTGEVIQRVYDNGTIVSVTSYRKRDFDNQRHCHQNTNISFVLHGGCELKKKNSRELFPGEIVFNYAGEYHRVKNVAKYSRHINIEIEPTFFTKYKLDESYVLTSLDKKLDSKFLMLKILKELHEPDHFSSISINMMLLELVNHMPKIKYADPSRWPIWMTAVKDYLHDNWNDKISLQELAKVANVHPVTISRYFSKYFCCSLGEYVRKIKIEKALALIKRREQSLTCIAYECGFSDQSHFIRTFKEFTGFLPFAYKNL